MKPVAVSVIGSLLAFAAGLVTASSWNWNSRTVRIEPPGVTLLERCPPNQTQTPSTEASLTVVAPNSEFVFAQGRLRLVPEQVQLTSKSLRYEIDVSYPQIVGTEEPQIQKINQHMKELATRKYQWPLNPSKADLRSSQEKYPGVLNSVNLTYEIGLATDSFLSIYFVGYSYGIGAAHSVQESLAVNYDLTLGKRLKLSDIFKPGSKYLEFISRRCIDELSRGTDRGFLSIKALAPAAENFKSWHITSNGIRFNFDACKVFACAEGDQTVEITFTDLKQLLNPGIPGKFKTEET